MGQKFWDVEDPCEIYIMGNIIETSCYFEDIPTTMVKSCHAIIGDNDVTMVSEYFTVN